MKAEDEPVSDDEFILRLVWHDFFKQSDPLPVKPRAFHPRQNETTGISVFRLACLSNPADALAAIPDAEKRSLYFIAALPVAAIKPLGLTVSPDRIAEVPGHAVLSELNCNSWDADKALWKPRLEELARLASSNIVHQSESRTEAGK